MRSLVRVARITLLVGLVSMTACAESFELRAAERGDRVALRDAIARRGAGMPALSNGEAMELARAVARREIESAADEPAIARIRAIGPCARELDGALSARMRRHDAAGAAAALARVEGRGLGAEDLRRFADEASPPWRAAGVRGLIRSADAVARRRALLDPEPAVRRQAARACREAADPSDRDALAQAARLDPEPIVRTEAVRALAALRSEGPAWDAARVDALRDLWIVGDDGVREDIARAWCNPPLWRSGGKEAVRAVVASTEGAGAVEAAAAVLARSPRDADVAGEAAGRLVAAIGAGGPSVRLQAVLEAPLDRPEIRTAIHAASDPGTSEPSVRIAALGRLAAAGDKAAQTALEELGRPDGSAISARARFALASAGDRRVQAWVEADRSDPSPERRVDAAVALGALGVPSRAAPLLADPDADVRVRAACVMLVAGRTAR